MVSIAQQLENWTLPHKIWKTGAPLPVSLLEGATAVINNQLYVFGGFTFGLQASKEVYSYNLEADRWTRLTEMPTAVTHINAAVDYTRSTIWFAGGFIGNHPGPATDEVWQYDTSRNSWIPGIPLPEPRAGGGLQIINQELHYFGGFAADRNTTCAEHWSLSLEGGTEWIEKAPLSDPRGHLPSVVIAEKIYAIGGQHGHDINPIDVDSAHVYDCAKDTWLELANLPEPRSHCEWSTFAIDDYIVMIGGRNNQNTKQLGKSIKDIINYEEDELVDDIPLQLFMLLKKWLKKSPYSTKALSSIIVYNIRENTWNKLASLPTHLFAPMANAIGNCLIIAGGGRNRAANVQARTLLNQSLIDVIKTKS